MTFSFHPEAITMKYKQMNAELVQDKNLSDKIMQRKKYLLADLTDGI